MSAERIDAETLAAFLDGKLEPAERERVLRILAEQPEEYEVFVDAAHIAARLERSTRTGGAEARRVSGATRRYPRAKWTVPLAIAASVAAIALIPGLTSDDETLPIELARHLAVVSSPGPGSLAARLGSDWDQPGWSVTRGGGAGVPEQALAFRLGARATDVEIALNAADTTALRLVGENLLELVSGIDGGAGAAAQYRQLLSQGTLTSAEARRSAAAGARGLTADSPWFDLGAWSESARIAAAAGQIGYVTGQMMTLDSLLARIADRSDSAAPGVVQILRELQASARPENAEAVRQLLARVMAVAGD
jgi:hypothetical protein